MLEMGSKELAGGEKLAKDYQHCPLEWQVYLASGQHQSQIKGLMQGQRHDNPEVLQLLR